MRLLVVNPNTTASMTRKIGAAAAPLPPPAPRSSRSTPRRPAGIEGYYDEAFSVPGLLRNRAAQGIDGMIIACFDDTGLDAARCLTDAPVDRHRRGRLPLGGSIADQFSVVTTLSRSVPAIEHNLVRYGLAGRCARVRASDVPVLDLGRGRPRTPRRIAGEIGLAIDEDRAEAIVLGCAGMTDLAASFAEEYGAAGPRRRRLRRRHGRSHGPHRPQDQPPRRLRTPDRETDRVGQGPRATPSAANADRSMRRRKAWPAGSKRWQSAARMPIDSGRSAATGVSPGRTRQKVSVVPGSWA